MRRCWFLLSGPLAMLIAGWLGAASPSRTADFTSMWWVDGPPSFLTHSQPPASEVLALRSGEIGLMLDTRTLRCLHAGRFGRVEPFEESWVAGTEPLRQLPAFPMEFSVQTGGKTFLCQGRSRETKDEFFQPVRFVESGRFFQRVRIEGLFFTAADGEKLPATASLEVALWPDLLLLTLALDEGWTAVGAELVLAAGDQSVRARLPESRRITLPCFRGQGQESGGSVTGSGGLRVNWDPQLQAHRVHLPESPWSNARGTYYPEEHLDRLDRWPLVLANDTDEEQVVRLCFEQEQHLPITGFTPMLCDADGTPTGCPVQISKNWHRREDKGHLVHEGPWFHGYALLRLPAHTRRSLLLQMVYARYGGVPAASHAQLSLIGWGHNQFWDEAALGSFGESICFEPGRVQRRCFMDDMRPLMTLPVEGGKPWGWAGNAGGGDFLMWLDQRGAYHGFRATRTDYRAQGPCRTEVRYREETVGGEMESTVRVSLARSDDFLRVYLHLRYDVRHPVSFSRLAFLQLGADYYNETPARRVAMGDMAGLREEWSPSLLSGGFDRRSLPLLGRHPWVSIHGLETNRLGRGVAAASRGIIVRDWEARLGGRKNAIPHVSTYGNEWGRGNFKTVVELSPPPGISTLQRGDYVDAIVEMVVFPADARAYYGPNDPFRAALSRQADTWALVHREAVGQAPKVRVRRGQWIGNFPLVVAADRAGRMEVDLEGGEGWLPLTVAGLHAHRGFKLRVDGQPLGQEKFGNDYWQTDFEPVTGTWLQSFNVPLGGERKRRLQFGPEQAGR